MVVRQAVNQLDAKSADQLNQAFNALRHPYRRCVLCVLINKPRDQDVPLAELHDRYVDDEPLIIEANHIHLPKLVNSGYIEWEKANDRIRRGSRFDEISPVLELLNNHQDELPGEWPSPG